MATEDEDTRQISVVDGAWIPKKLRWVPSASAMKVPFVPGTSVVPLRPWSVSVELFVTVQLPLEITPMLKLWPFCQRPVPEDDAAERVSVPVVPESSTTVPMSPSVRPVHPVLFDCTAQADVTVLFGAVRLTEFALVLTTMPFPTLLLVHAPAPFDVRIWPFVPPGEHPDPPPNDAIVIPPG